MSKKRCKKIIATIEGNEIEITPEFITKYKNDTRRKRITQRGIEKFFNNLVCFFKTF